MSDQVIHNFDFNKLIEFASTAKGDVYLKTPEGDILLDATGKKSGRGAYVCPDPECLKKARKSRALERAFDTAIPAEVYDALEGQMVAL